VRKFLATLILGVIPGVAAHAQVGYPPAQSPFTDVEERHTITVFGGYFSAKKDVAKVAPQSGAMGGLQYEWRASGPLHLGTSVMGVNSARTTLDPAKPIASRVVGTESQPLIAGDLFLAVALTGERSWHSLMPMLGAGLGIVSDLKGADVGGFRFGTRFALPWSVGVRIIPSRSFQLRAEIKDWLYTIKYPQGYYSSSTGDDPILSAGTPASRWTNNFAMTVGGSFTFKR
jgi:hypothetical protein